MTSSLRGEGAGTQNDESMMTEGPKIKGIKIRKGSYYWLFAPDVRDPNWPSLLLDFMAFQTFSGLLCT